MNSHLKGLMITIVAILAVTPDSLYVRLIDAEPMVTAFWRSLTAGLFVFVGVFVVSGPRSFNTIRSAGPPAWLYMALIGSTAPAFVLAVTYTSVANAVFIFASMPIFAAVFSKVFLGEAISPRMIATMIVVMFGLALIAYGSGQTEVASWKGDIWALYVSMAYAAALTAVRKVKEISLIPVIGVAYIAAACVILLFVEPWSLFALKWQLLLTHGAFIALGTCLLAVGPRYITSAEVSLLVLLESVLAPILVWLVIGEDPGRWALFGGAIVIGALIVSNLVAMRRRRGTSSIST